MYNTTQGPRGVVSVEKKTLIALTYMATQMSVRKIGDQFNVADSTALNSIEKFLAAVLMIKDHYIKWPSEEECVIIESQFKSLANFPGVIGAIDGCHIEGKFANSIAHHYNNRKSTQSMVLQGVCTAKKIFTNIYVGCTGRNHDAKVLSRSQLGKKIREEGHTSLLYRQEFHLLGDSAYSLRTWCMVPYKNNGRMTESQKKYNVTLSKTRVVIENVFGMVKGRWRRLKYVDVQTPRNIATRITAACVLHNFCLLHDDIIEEILVNPHGNRTLPGMTIDSSKFIHCVVHK
uniref:Nuclease HARBI1 n=3 Tax=Cacopsylla melanoneura TaxID=428564 RepID=A0A8D8W1P2_9HEMI